MKHRVTNLDVRSGSGVACEEQCLGSFVESVPMACCSAIILDVGRVEKLGSRPTTLQDVIVRAEGLGMSRIVLNPLPAMIHARTLFESLGLVACVPYIANPTDGMRFFKRLFDGSPR